MQIEREITAVKQNDDIVQRLFVLLFFFAFAKSPAKSSAQSVHVATRFKFSVQSIKHGFQTGHFKISHFWM